MKSSSMRVWAFSLLALTAGAAFGQKKPLDHSVYDGWKSVGSRQMSDDGKWLSYTINPQEGDGVLEVKSLVDGKTFKIERGAGARFSGDSKFVVATIQPKFLEARQARRDKKPPNEMPKTHLVILNLTTGDQKVIEKVATFQMATEDKGYILYRPEPEAPKPAAAPGAAAPPSDEEGMDQRPPGAGQGQRGPGAGGAAQPAGRSGEKYKLMSLAGGWEEEIPNVASTAFNKFGNFLAVAQKTADGKGDGITIYSLPVNGMYTVAKGAKMASGATHFAKIVVTTGQANYSRITMTEDGSQLAYLTDRDDAKAKKPTLSLYAWSLKADKENLIAKPGSDGMTKDWVIASSGTLSFSKSGKRLMFSTQPKPEEDPAPVPDDEKVSLDVWNWKDPLLQPQQLLQAAAARNQSFMAVANLGKSKILQIESPELANVTATNDGDGDYAIGVNGLPYRLQQSWTEGANDYYRVNLNTAEVTPILINHNGSVIANPKGTWLLVTDDPTQKIYSVNMANLAKTQIGAGIKFPLFNELNDVPAAPNIYPLNGFSEDGNSVYLNDRFDIWKVDMTGKNAEVNVTRGFGRALKTTFHFVQLDPDSEGISPEKSAVLTAFNENTKGGGYYSIASMDGKSRPEKLILENMLVGGMMKAKNSDVITFTKQTFEMYPDVWQANMKFEGQKKLTEANPQQKDYAWGTSELVSWTSNDGDDLDGVLIKPGNFDPLKKYPMVVYFYERNSETLFRYYSPAPSASTINPSFFASNGYVVFIPDIPYKSGYPGESAISAILPGVHKVLSYGFVDQKRMGIQGQSWGGYQVAYMVTETNLFAAASAGAPVSNMFSAYGGIRWGSGLVRGFQYEVGQSRIGFSPWEKPLRYLENSPIFFADKVKTPLLIMSNDQDGAVPWYQGIEYFTALRRLQKPSWLLVYNGEDHNIVQRKNRKDFTIRLSQFFDHYLKGAPMPVWMADGIPATQKGRTMGLELKGGGK